VPGRTGGGKRILSNIVMMQQAETLAHEVNEAAQQASQDGEAVVMMQQAETLAHEVNEAAQQASQDGEANVIEVIARST